MTSTRRSVSTTVGRSPAAHLRPTSHSPLSPFRPEHAELAGDPGVTEADSYRYRWAALSVLCASVLIVNVDNTILNVALPTLVHTLHATSSQLQWIVDSYAMVFAGLLLVGGSLADRFGRKRFLLTGLSVFVTGSVGAAFCGAVDALIAWRAVMGAGAALTMPSTLSIINDIFRDPAERARAIGAWAGTSGLGIAIGPIAGGLLLNRFWWGSVFLVNVPIVVAGLVGALALVPDSKKPFANRPDPVGSVLSLNRFWWGSVFLVNVPIVVAGLVGALALVPDSKKPFANRPDPVGSVLS